MREKLLVVDDLELIRVMTRALFEKKYDVEDASCGDEAMEILHRMKIDVILLDLYMPGKNGLEVVREIKADKHLCDIPIVVITSSEGVNDQLQAFELGVDDYITKPIIPEIALHRVNNVVQSHKRMLKVMEERKSLIRKAELDGLTGIYNKITTERKIAEALAGTDEGRHALLVFDIDNFKEVNDEEGHLIGDHTLKIVADLISSNFRNTDIVGRIGGDEFVVFMKNVTDESQVESKAQDLIRLLYFKPNLTIPANVSFSVGIAFTGEGSYHYETLFKRADEALYFCKKNGRNRYHIYGSDE